MQLLPCMSSGRGESSPCPPPPPRSFSLVPTRAGISERGGRKPGDSCGFLFPSFSRRAWLPFLIWKAAWMAVAIRAAPALSCSVGLRAKEKFQGLETARTLGRGCELNSSAQSYTFKVQDDSDHILFLKTVCLLEGAKDECNVVEVVGHSFHNEEIAVPVANLKLSCQPLLSLNNFQLQPPVTFRLCSGSGPVHLAGLHQIFHRRDLLDDELSEEEEDFSEKDESSDTEELSPIKPAKKKQQKS